MPTVGSRIRQARKLRKLSQVALAKAAGITQPSLSELETGETKEITGATLIGIAEALRVRPQWLMLGKGAMEQDAADLALETHELEMLDYYRQASPRWQMSLRLMARLPSDDLQDEVASSVNMVMAAVAGRAVSDERVAGAFGKAPHVKAKAPAKK